MNVRMHDVMKSFGGVQALDRAYLDVGAGEIHALLGANGSGKSTLAKILTGVVAADQAVITVGGDPYDPRKPTSAYRRGIAAIYQEFSLVPYLSVADNVVLGAEPVNRFGMRNPKLARELASEVLARFADRGATPIPLDALVGRLPPAERQVVEIAKAFARRPRLLVLDEATASLRSREVEVLFQLVRELAASGGTAIFISHRLAEVRQLCQRATVLRGGRVVGSVSLAETSETELLGMLTTRSAGHALGERRPAGRIDAGILLEVRGLSGRKLRNVTFGLRAGELLGLGGLQGQGQTELLGALFGALPHGEGGVLLNGRSLRLHTPIAAIRQGLALVPGDRSRLGLFLQRPVQENLTCTSLARSRRPFRMISRSRDRRLAGAAAQRLHIMGSLREPVSSLSGGNQQKVVLGKWLATEPSVLLLDDPTKGVDVDAKEEFYGFLRQMLDQGTGILLNSSDDSELVRLCDRVLVMADGAIATELGGSALTEESLVATALGFESAANGGRR